MSQVNELLKLAGVKPANKLTEAQVEQAVSQLAKDAAIDGQVNEGVFSTLKAILATVGQAGSKAGKAAAEKAAKLPSTIKALYKETEVKDQLRILYRSFNTMLTTLDKVTSTTKTIQEKDPEIKRELELFTGLMRRTIDSLQARAGLSVAVKEGFAADELATLLQLFEAGEKVMQVDGGYSINGCEYVSDEAEALVDEAKQMAYDAGKKWQDVLLSICPKEQLDESTYVSSAEFSDDFYKLFDTLKDTASDVSGKKAKLRNWLRRKDFANQTQADEMFDLFLHKFSEAMVALKSCEKHLQQKL